MNVVIAGGTGFLGRSLAAGLASGHDVVVLSRDPAKAPPPGARRLAAWSPEGDGAWRDLVAQADVVVNLAGESIAARRWSAPQKRRILESRLRATRALVRALAAAPPRPRTFVSASAVGYYGPLGDEVVTEAHPAGSDFLADVCRQWEAAALEAGRAARVVCVRTGLVLDRRGGALPRMLPPFWIGAGGPLGSGRQYWPWIHLADWTALVRWTIETPDVSGPVNATAPEPVTNAEFARELGRVLHRPAVLPTPAFLLRLVLGEMADALLLSGQRAIPAKAQQLGFTFRYGQVGDALRAIFRP